MVNGIASLDANKKIPVAQIPTLTTDIVTEGANKYYTDVRADNRIAAQKGVAGGLASLDSTGKIPMSQLPNISFSSQSFT